jgi:hypothetical protein
LDRPRHALHPRVVHGHPTLVFEQEHVHDSPELSPDQPDSVSDPLQGGAPRWAEKKPLGQGRWDPTGADLSRAPPLERPTYDEPVPRIWLVALAILVACLLASMVIATVKLA